MLWPIFINWFATIGEDDNKTVNVTWNVTFSVSEIVFEVEYFRTQCVIL